MYEFCPEVERSKNIQLRERIFDLKNPGNRKIVGVLELKKEARTPVFMRVSGTYTRPLVLGVKAADTQDMDNSGALIQLSRLLFQQAFFSQKHGF